MISTTTRSSADPKTLYTSYQAQLIAKGMPKLQAVSVAHILAYNSPTSDLSELAVLHSAVQFLLKFK